MSDFVFATAQYESGDWDSAPLVPSNIIDTIARYTSIEVAPSGVIVPEYIISRVNALYVLPFIKLYQPLCSYVSHPLHLSPTIVLCLSPTSTSIPLLYLSSDYHYP